VGRSAGLDDMEKQKFLTLPGLEFRLQSVASRYNGVGCVSSNSTYINFVLTNELTITILLFTKIVVLSKYLRKD
jgi:hypothetical protein